MLVEDTSNPRNASFGLRQAGLGFHKCSRFIQKWLSTRQFDSTGVVDLQVKDVLVAMVELELVRRHTVF